MNSARLNYLPFFMWLFPLLFFAFQFILRLWPGLMMHQIMTQFSIDATHFGMLAAFYYYGYAGMQIPVAFLLDRFRARYIVGAFAVICGIATLIFTYTQDFYLAVLGRFLIGAGSAAGFLGVSKVLSEWFPKIQYARMVGFSFTVGLLGAIYGGKPVSLLINSYPWQNVAVTLAVISIVWGIGTILLLRSPSNLPNEKTSDAVMLLGFKDLFFSSAVWLLASANLLMVGSLEGFADVWGVPYLMTAYHLPKEEAAGLVSFIFVGMLVGGPLLAFCSKRVGNYAVIVACGLGMALEFILLLWFPSYPRGLLASLFFSIGVMCCYQVIIFAAGAELVTSQLLGITIALLNCINMLGGSFFHTCIGRIMDIFWTGEFGEMGLKQYSCEAYQYALSIIPFCAIVGSAMAFWVSRRLKSEI